MTVTGKSPNRKKYDMNKSIELTDGEFHYSFGYYSQNKWIDDKRVVLIRSLSPDISSLDGKFTTELVVFDTESGEIIPIAWGVNTWCDYVVGENRVFYIKGDSLLKLDILTGETKEIFEENGIGSPHITADGKYLSVFRCKPEISSFWRIEIDTGASKKLLDKAFAEPFPYANHGMISPKDENKIFFSHEGNTRYITNRLWLYDDSKKLDFNIARQRLGKNGELIDCYGHECWSHDGKGLYFVKYRESEAPRGICYVDIETGEQRLLFSGYDYWHVSASYSERYIAADTRNLGGNKSGVVLIDLKNGEEKMIDTVSTTFKHPCHPHPQISPNQRKIIYHFSNDRKKCCVRVANLL
jgi:Tol biopolymer transport system component